MGMSQRKTQAQNQDLNQNPVVVIAIQLLDQNQNLNQVVLNHQLMKLLEVKNKLLEVNNNSRPNHKHKLLKDNNSKLLEVNNNRPNHNSKLLEDNNSSLLL